MLLPCSTCMGPRAVGSNVADRIRKLCCDLCCDAWLRWLRPAGAAISAASVARALAPCFRQMGRLVLISRKT